MIDVLQIPILYDNYVYVLVNTQNNEAVVIDPGRVEVLLEILQKHNLKLTAIWNTHHHWDHTDGNEELLKIYPDLQVLGGVYDAKQNRIPGLTKILHEGDKVIFAGVEFEILEIPGHTLGHIAYYGGGKLFCGDTLFVGGCGRLFEGTPQQMYASLQKLMSLPEDTTFYCTHEYTKKNLEFALTVEKSNPDLQDFYKKVCEGRKHNQPTTPSRLGDEKKWNPFLRASDAEQFAKLRAMKDNF